MVTVISAPNSYTTVIALERGSVFYSGGIVPDEAGHLVRMDCIATGETRIVAKKDLVIAVEGLWHDPCTGANHILFIRADRTSEGAGSLWLGKPQQNPELRKALLDANVPHIEAVKGFDHVLVYNDEIAVPESKTGFGFFGWIVKRDDVEKYLKAETQKKCLGRMRRLTIWHEIHLDHNGEKVPSVRIEGWSEPPPIMDMTLWAMTEFTVWFNDDSRIVHRIAVTNAFVENIPCDRSPIRSIKVGKRLPDSLGRKK